MFVRKLLPGAAAALVVITLTPRPASADWTFTPFVGGNFGGNADFGPFNDFDDEIERRVNFGASLGWMGAGIVGFEADFGFSPNFFQDTAGDADFGFGDSNVTTLMANVIVGAPIGGQYGPGIRPYGSGGIGLIRSHVSGGDFFDDLDTNDLGFNVGGGIQGFFNDTFGIRGDVRYFRALTDDEPDNDVDLALSSFDFWRATVGLSIRFGQ